MKKKKKKTTKQKKNTEVGCHFHLQGIITTQGLDPGLSLTRQILYHLSHQGGLLSTTGVQYMGFYERVKIQKIIEPVLPKDIQQIHSTLQ